ncbi:hypothetical protein DFH08DRAFT_321406 [Mycena albidolilacea]|uniref:Uncharacterized protein n=1 Tax=Mycena albidolilacea TaxID=1033008 RepID=A0AAD7ALD4_9AGAR|nr:hypothetical protein DFH08DRAFT_321406 [Mycena albidolilacea]
MSSSSQESVVTVASLGDGGERLMYVVLGLVAQTFFFGVYTVLLFISTRMLLKRGLKIQSNKIMLLVTLFMYSISAAYWAYSVIYATDRLRAQINLSSKSPIPDHDQITRWLTLINAIVMINYILTDGVVIWRVWVICRRDLRKYLWVAMGFLILTTVAIFLTIAFRIVSSIKPSAKNSFLNPGIDILQISTGVLSLYSNLASTSVVAITALGHRRALRDAFAVEEASTRSDQILALLVEVGTFYFASTLFALMSALIRLPYGTLGDLYSPINVQIAGAYPPIVILLVSTKRSWNETAFSDTTVSRAPRSSSAYPIQFGGADTVVDGTGSLPASRDHDKRIEAEPFA